MAISKCALAVITDRGRNVVDPSWSVPDATEEDFLERHVDDLRSRILEGDARGRFTADSRLYHDFQSLIDGDREQFIEVCVRLVRQLAGEMQHVRSASCVVAILVRSTADERPQVSILKLDAEIEAAQLEQTANGIRLRVFEDLLPSPGDIQKGLSWPDPRSPDSDVVLLDKVQQGSATKYFQRAFGIVASPRPKDTEDALRRDLSALPADEVALAIDAIGQGGPIPDVVARIRNVVPTFSTSAETLATHEAPPGYVRRGFDVGAQLVFEAPGVLLRVTARARARIETRREGAGYVTTIRTSTPLTPPVDDDGGGLA